ncbi:NodT family efflux transporter outer membrane factor (OMF) lipoprotein [Pseudomonas nitritireducens]|uniref:NodT family efflux transporter outer membrane factor (OMF) lipoprotein n=1 Tax=Pseudomonas nitroreducens TaxID=46680 RepID=A0A7W7KH86_PSENT|nr:efflux transporter outer membrane subunit [Pseudomonas nitritireducens]MBB4862787.1 NodT family efflux transporter outer membrane factor (OMF) lipoprotein [Pseudomonas nitritireducens]
MRPRLPLICLLLAGCSLQEPAPPAEIAAPAAWTHTATPAAVAVDAQWWKQFGSAELDELVQRAARDSYDLQAAEARLRQARASLRIAGAPLLPEVNGTLNASRQGRLGGNADVDGNTFGLGLQTRYELDLWGRNRALRDAARAQWQASEYDLHSVHLSLTAAVATAWLEHAGLGERLRIAGLNLKNAEDVLATLESRQRAGAAMPLELAQQRALLAGLQVEQADLRQQVAQSEVAVAVLLGAARQSLRLQNSALSRLRDPDIAAGVPSQLLSRRPDLARAEAQLQSAAADLGAARAALFPQLTLGLDLGSGGPRLGDLTDNPLYQLSGGLVAPIFNNGRLSGQRDLAQARQEELLADYRAAIVSAFGEVESGLDAISGLDTRLQAQAEQVRQAERAFDLANSRYRAGAEDLLVLLDAQHTLYAAQDGLASLRQLRLQASVALYKALGGGWQARRGVGGA